MKKVLFVVQDFELGGTPVVLSRLIRGLDRSRFKPLLALMNARGPLLSALPQDCEVFDLRKGTRRGFPGAVLRYAALEQRLSADVVLSALPNANILCCLARKINSSSPPLIVTEHVAHISYLGDPRHRFTPLAIRQLYGEAAKVVAVSDGLRDELESFYDLPANRLTRIYNPIDLEAVRDGARARVELLPELDGPLIVSVGRLAEQKSPMDCVDAFDLLERSLNARLAFVGDGPLRPTLEAEVARRGLAARVFFVGSDANPFRWLDRASVFVSSSVYEGFSLTIAEAMAAGVPVIATDCPHGPRELLQDGRCGVLVPPRRPRVLAEALASLLTDPDRARRLVAAASMRVRDFEQGTVVGRYQSLFEEVMR